MTGQIHLFGEPANDARLWTVTDKFDRDCARLADEHYSRRTPGSPQFMPPGQTLVLKRTGAVWGWWRPDPSSGIRQMNGIDGWTCSLFRNASDVLSSTLVLAAEEELQRANLGCGPHGMVTYVWDARIRSINPGCCYKKVGWRRIGRSADGRKTLLWKPYHLAGIARRASSRETSELVCVLATATRGGQKPLAKCSAQLAWEFAV